MRKPPLIPLTALSRDDTGPTPIDFILTHTYILLKHAGAQTLTYSATFMTLQLSGLFLLFGDRCLPLLTVPPMRIMAFLTGPYCTLMRILRLIFCNSMKPSSLYFLPLYSRKAKIRQRGKKQLKRRRALWFKSRCWISAKSKYTWHQGFGDKNLFSLTLKAVYVPRPVFHSWHCPAGGSKCMNWKLLGSSTKWDAIPQAWNQLSCYFSPNALLLQLLFPSLPYTSLLIPNLWFTATTLWYLYATMQWLWLHEKGFSLGVYSMHSEERSN